MSTTITTPAPQLLISKLSGETLTVLMSFGLLNKLAAMVGSLQSLPEIYLTPELQDSVIYEILVGREETGQPTQPYKLYQFAENISPDEGLKILEWCEAHLYDFFMKRLRAAQRLQEKAIQMMKG